MSSFLDNSSPEALVSLIGPIVQCPCALPLAPIDVLPEWAFPSTRQRRRASLSPTGLRLPNQRASFVTSLHATEHILHFTRRVARCFFLTARQVWHPRSASRPVTTMFASRRGPSLRAASLAARVEREARLSEAARTNMQPSSAAVWVH